MNIKNVNKLLKSVIDIGKKSPALVKKCGTEAVNFISKHKIESCLTFFGSYFAVDDYRVRKLRKQEREKNKLYQEALRKHQVQISALKSAKEREEYRNQLWEDLSSKSEE